MTKSPAITKALSHLPPEIIEALSSDGIEPMRIEDSGAMRFRISNKTPVSQKADVISEFRSLLHDYGLDLVRCTTDITPQWDMSLLMIKRNPMSQVVPLFSRTGEPYPESISTREKSPKASLRARPSN